MQLACPACAATYQVPDALIGGGRQMQCVRCGEAWFATAPSHTETPASPPVAPAVPRTAPPAHTLPSEPAIAAPIGGSRRLALAWSASIIVWLGGLYALWHARLALAEAWPPIARPYAALGLE
ncbi:MAG: zinc-ribbon domain-containing protein [Rubritepida sp.]|nr:zinc-ribbon domain-containing protein [Rubritepida sp.]